MDASEVRRGLQLAITALQDAAAQSGDADPAPADLQLLEAARKLGKALADLDDGSLAEMDVLIEDVRKELA